jgi:hypothetical protein
MKPSPQDFRCRFPELAHAVEWRNSDDAVRLAYRDLPRVAWDLPVRLSGVLTRAGRARDLANEPHECRGWGGPPCELCDNAGYAEGALWRELLALFKGEPTHAATSPGGVA